MAGYQLGTNGTGGAVTLTNAGSITGNYGAYFQAGGRVTNQSTGKITGAGTAGIGIEIKGGGTIINAGTIVGTGTVGDAVEFVGSYSNRLIIDPGGVFTGAIVGGSGNDTLELDGTAGNPLTVDYKQLPLTNFEEVAFGAGGYARLQLFMISGTMPLTVSNFTLRSDTVDLEFIGTNGTVTNNDTVAHRITVSGSAGTLTLQLDATDATVYTTASDGRRSATAAARGS